MPLDKFADLSDDDLEAVANSLEETRARTVVGDLWGWHLCRVHRGANFRVCQQFSAL